jgi:hypothetical protein
MKLLLFLIALTFSLTAFSANFFGPKEALNSSNIFKISKPVASCGPGQKPPCDPVTGTSL